MKNKQKPNYIDRTHYAIVAYCINGIHHVNRTLSIIEPIVLTDPIVLQELTV